MTIEPEPKRRTRGNWRTRLLDAAIAAERAAERPSPVQLDLFPEILSVTKPRPGRPRTARIVYRGSNRRGFRRE